MSRKRDRHGRGFRGILPPPHTPGYRTRRQRFDDLVVDAARALLEKYPRRLANLHVSVQETPGSDPAPWEEQRVPLGRFFPADRETPPTLVIYRRPIVTRSNDWEDTKLLVRQALSQQLSGMIGKSPEEIDPQAWPEDF
ncbi:metallopeptidase family protein [Dermabacteraceae bacterium P13138]